MNVLTTSITGLLLIEPKVWGDARGFFFESYQHDRYVAAGIPGFVQDNFSSSKRGVLRGLHFQNPNGQGKLVQALRGSVYDVALDLRKGSPTFGKWEAFELTEANRRQLYLPPGFAHGFCVTSDDALFHYKCTELYCPKNEHSILWNDPDLCIPWPVVDPEVSIKDVNGTPISAVPEEWYATV